jgi:EmrB/QacA subfamily drug resistance transporter
VPTLIAGRAVQGLGAAFVLPATLSIVTNAFDRDERNKAIAVWTAVGGMGIGFGPAIGGYLVDRYEWSAAFWIFVPIILLVLVGQVLVPESRDSRRVGLDIPGAITATLGISTLVFGVIQGPEAGWTSPLIVASFTLAVTLLAAFVAVERRAADPMLPLHFFRERDFTGSAVIIGLMFFAGPSTFFFLTQFFQIVQGRSALSAGLLIIPASVAMMFGAPLSGKLMHTIGPRYLVLAMTAAMVTGVLLLSGIDAESSTLSVIIPLGIFGFGAGLGMPALTDTVMAAVPEADAGIGSAVNDVSRELGGALGIATIGSVVSSIYRSNVSDSLEGALPADVVEFAGDSVGVANAAAQGRPAESAATVVEAANAAFVDAMVAGFQISAVVLLAAVVIAFTLIPKRMRTAQAEAEERAPRIEPGIEPHPQPAAA